MSAVKGLFPGRSHALGSTSVQVESDGLLRTESTASVWSDEEDEAENASFKDKLAALLKTTLRTLVHRPYINPRDRLLLSPWQKWKKYNRIPYKVSMHVLLFVLVFTQVVILYVETASYNRSAQKTLSNTFLGGETLDSDDYYTIEEFYDIIGNVTYKYYNVQHLLVGKFVHHHHNSQYVPPVLKARFFRKPLFNETSRNFAVSNDLDLVTKKYELTPEHPVGPFNISDATLFHRLYNMQISFHLLSLNIGLLGPIPYDWHIILHFDVVGSVVHSELSADPTVYEVSGYFPLSLFIGFHCAVTVLAMITLLLELKSGFSSIKIFLVVRQKYKSIPRTTRKSEGYPKWGKIRRGVKLKFVKLWTIWTIFTCLCLLTGAALGMLQVFGYSITTLYRIFQGLGAFGATMVLLRYLEYVQSLYTLLLTVRVSFWKIIRLVIDSVPFFLAYVLMGITMFSSHSVRFKSIQDTSVTLFSLLNGDAIRDAFADLMEHYPYPLIAEIYLYTFVALFITAILNVFIFIIEDAYHTAKEARTANAENGTDGELDGGLGNPVEHGHSHGAKRRRRKDTSAFTIHDLFHVLEREFGDTLFPKPDQPASPSAAPSSRSNSRPTTEGDVERSALMVEPDAVLSGRPNLSLTVTSAPRFSSVATRPPRSPPSSDEEDIDLSALGGLAGATLTEMTSRTAHASSRNRADPSISLIQLNKLREDVTEAVDGVQEAFYAELEEQTTILREKYDRQLRRRLARLFEKMRIQVEPSLDVEDFGLGIRRRGVVRSRSVASSPTTDRKTGKGSNRVSRSHSGAHLHVPGTLE